MNNCSLLAMTGIDFGPWWLIMTVIIVLVLVVVAIQAAFVYLITLAVKKLFGQAPAADAQPRNEEDPVLLKDS